MIFRADLGVFNDIAVPGNHRLAGTLFKLPSSQCWVGCVGFLASQFHDKRLSTFFKLNFNGFSFRLSTHANKGTRIGGRAVEWAWSGCWKGHGLQGLGSCHPHLHIPPHFFGHHQVTSEPANKKISRNGPFFIWSSTGTLMRSKKFTTTKNIN